METYGKWNEEVKAVLAVVCITDGYEITDRNLIEVLHESKEVYREITDQHRWYNDELRVVKIGDAYIGYEWGNNTGDDSLSDLGWEFDLGSVMFYEPKEVVQVIFVPKETKDGD